jgi:putative oxidoreductase
MSSPSLTHAAPWASRITGSRHPVAQAVTRLTITGNDAALTIARLVLGGVMFAHGAQKLLGWFGGYGFSGTLGYFQSALHIPATLGVIAILAEFFGGVALLLGAFGRIAALGIVVNMVVAVLTVHLPNGFFMNWAGQQAGEGYEYHLLALALALVVLIRGSGSLSIDRWLSRSR